MSMNIACKEMELPQIGSWESELILSYNSQGESDGGWEGAFRRLVLFWRMNCQHEFNRESTNPERQQEIKEYYFGLIEQLRNCMDEQKVLHFYLV